VDTENPNHAAVLGRWGRALSLLCSGGSHERYTEQSQAVGRVTNQGDVPRAKGRAA